MQICMMFDAHLLTLKSAKFAAATQSPKFDEILSALHRQRSWQQSANRSLYVLSVMQSSERSLWQTLEMKIQLDFWFQLSSWHHWDPKSRPK